jgi:hypothetical protein
MVVPVTCSEACTLRAVVVFRGRELARGAVKSRDVV